MKFTLNRRFCLVSLSGHAIQFEKDKPADVPANMAHEAMAIGAVPVDGMPEVPEQVVLAAESDPVKRQAQVLKAMKIISERGQRNDFAASGRPHTKVVSKLLGYEIDIVERDKMWDLLQQADAQE